MKKLIIITLALAALLLFAGCADTESVPEAAENAGLSPEENVPEPAAEETGGVSYYSLGLTDEGFFEGVTARDIVSLPEYKGVEYPQSLIEVPDEAVDEQIALVLADYASYEEVYDRAIVDGDTVNIDYVGSIDGVEFEGGSTRGAGTDVTIGVTQYIDDFLEQLIGHMPGENFDIEVTFPENYGVDTLNGKDAIFNITINYIAGDEIIPEFSDKIAADYGFGSTDEMRADIAQWLLSEARSAFVDDLLSGAECEEFPEGVITYFKNYMKSTYEDYFGVDLKTIISYYGMSTEEEFFEQNMDTVLSMALRYLAVQAIAETEGIRVTEEDIAAEENLAGYLDYYGRPYVCQYLLSEKLIPDFIIGAGHVAESAAK